MLDSGRTTPQEIREAAWSDGVSPEGANVAKESTLGTPAHGSIVDDILDLITREKGLIDIHDDIAALSTGAGTATLDNQELILDGGTGNFDEGTDNLHAISGILRGESVVATHTVEAAHGKAETVIATFDMPCVGQLIVQFDVQSLIDAQEGDMLQFRLKHKIDGTNYRTIDTASFLVGTDEIHPELQGWLSEGAAVGIVTMQCSAAVTNNRNVPYKAMLKA